MGSIVDAIGGLFGRAAQTHQAEKSVSDFQNAAQDANKVANTAFGNQVQAYQPFYSGGVNAFNQAGQMQTPGFQYSPSDPSYQFRFDQGQKAVQGSAAARGGLFSGGAAKALTRYGQGAASQEFANDFSRNTQLANFGMQGAQGIATANANLASNTSNNDFNSARGTSAARADVGAGQAGQFSQGANLVSSVGKFFGF